LSYELPSCSKKPTSLRFACSSEMESTCQPAPIQSVSVDATISARWPNAPQFRMFGLVWRLCGQRPGIAAGRAFHTVWFTARRRADWAALPRAMALPGTRFRLLPGRLPLRPPDEPSYPLSRARTPGDVFVVV
jgi:hypothetical protein